MPQTASQIVQLSGSTWKFMKYLAHYSENALLYIPNAISAVQTATST